MNSLPSPWYLSGQQLVCGSIWIVDIHSGTAIRSLGTKYTQKLKYGLQVSKDYEVKIGDDYE